MRRRFPTTGITTVRTAAICLLLAAAASCHSAARQTTEDRSAGIDLKTFARFADDTARAENSLLPRILARSSAEPIYVSVGDKVVEKDSYSGPWRHNTFCTDILLFHGNESSTTRREECFAFQGGRWVVDSTTGRTEVISSGDSYHRPALAHWYPEPSTDQWWTRPPYTIAYDGR